ncbi:MAG: ATP-binding protein, partial [Saprospiraceae bacterium]|nr:ATP-binding protein [Saprospiraceae bacterium]
MDLDPEKLQQILSNLLSNAIKFTPEGGHVYVFTEQGEYNGKPSLELQVADTGIGIPEDKLEAVFDRFYQAPAPWAKAGQEEGGQPGLSYPPRVDRGELGGAGIGLSVARELARLLDGELIAG